VPIRPHGPVWLLNGDRLLAMTGDTAIIETTRVAPDVPEEIIGLTASVGVAELSVVQVAVPADTSLPPSIDGLIENNGLGHTSHNNVRISSLTVTFNTCGTSTLILLSCDRYDK
jgi:hypothetical protein